MQATLADSRKLRNSVPHCAIAYDFVWKILTTAKSFQTFKIMKKKSARVHRIHWTVQKLNNYPLIRHSNWTKWVGRRQSSIPGAATLYKLNLFSQSRNFRTHRCDCYVFDVKSDLWSQRKIWCPNHSHSVFHCIPLLLQFSAWICLQLCRLPLVKNDAASPIKSSPLNRIALATCKTTARFFFSFSLYSVRFVYFHCVLFDFASVRSVVPERSQ